MRSKLSLKKVTEMTDFLTKRLTDLLIKLYLRFYEKSRNWVIATVQTPVERLEDLLVGLFSVSVLQLALLRRLRCALLLRAPLGPAARASSSGTLSRR